MERKVLLHGETGVLGLVVAEWFPAAPAISGYFTGRLTHFFLGTSGGRGIIPQASLVTCLITFLFRVGQKLAKG